MTFQKGNQLGKLNKGHPDYLTPEQRKKNGKIISKAKKGKPLSEKQRISLLPYWQSKKGTRHTLEHRRKISESHRGEKAYQWKGGKATEAMKIRKSFEYKLWREAVFKRDNYTCIWCGLKGVYLNADHIQEFAYHPELRFAIDNGRTLCKECHYKRHSKDKQS